jgi:SAM-dependent methyltransferase
MTYDWQGTIAAEQGSPEYLVEVERRFLSECWFAQSEGGRAFSGLIDFDSLRGKDVLEIGCGTGVHTRLLAEAGARVTAVDLTPTAVELTTTRLALHGLEADVQEADAEQLPFADDSFDFVWSWGVIHHSMHTEAVVHEVARVLRSGGGFSFMVYHRSSISYWVQYQLIRGILQGRLLRESPAEIANRYSDGVVARHFTRREVERLLALSFTDVATSVMGQMGEAIPLPRGPRAKVAPLVPVALRQALLRRWGWFLFVSARRT